MPTVLPTVGRAPLRPVFFVGALQPPPGTTLDPRHIVRLKGGLMVPTVNCCTRTQLYETKLTVEHHVKLTTIVLSCQL